jgi:hypothetical protein
MDKILTNYNKHNVAISKSALGNDICEYDVYTISANARYSNCQKIPSVLWQENPKILIQCLINFNQFDNKVIFSFQNTLKINYLIELYYEWYPRNKGANMW